MISVWVAIDSTNQPLRNSVGSACSSDSSIQKVMKSKAELSGPKTYMKWRTNLMSQAAGRASASGSRPAGPLDHADHGGGRAEPVGGQPDLAVRRAPSWALAEGGHWGQ